MCTWLQQPDFLSKLLAFLQLARQTSFSISVRFSTNTWKYNVAYYFCFSTPVGEHVFWVFAWEGIWLKLQALRCSGLYQAGDGWTPPAHPPWTHLIWLIFHLTSSLAVFIWKAAVPDMIFIIAKLHRPTFCNGRRHTCKINGAGLFHRLCDIQKVHLQELHFSFKYASAFSLLCFAFFLLFKTLFSLQINLFFALEKARTECTLNASFKLTWEKLKIHLSSMIWKC